MANRQLRRWVSRLRSCGFAVMTAALCTWTAFMQDRASAESAGHCKGGLLACARQTPVSSLDFGLWTFGNELRSALLQGHVFKPGAGIWSHIGSTVDTEVLQIVVIDSGLKCDDLVRLLTNYIGHWGRMASIFLNEADIRSWTSAEADAQTSRQACRSIAGYVTPPDFGHISDQDLSELCAAIRIQILPVENPETKAFSKPCVVPLSNWRP